MGSERPDPPGPGLRVDVIDDGELVVAHLRGEVDLSTISSLRDAIEPHLGPSQTVVLDLSHLAFADSTFLALLAVASTTLTKGGGALLVRNPSEATRRLLSMVELHDLIDQELDRQSDVG